MGYCKDCRWWDSNNAPQLVGDGPPQIGRCLTELHIALAVTAQVAGAQPIVIDLFPHATFGCNQYQPKEPG